MIGLSFDIEDFQEGLTRPVQPHSVAVSPHFSQQCAYLLDLLHGRGIRATFFILGASIQQDPDLLKRIRDAGHEIAIHGFEHRRLDELSPAQFVADTTRAVELIRKTVPSPLLGYRAPFLSLNAGTSWIIEELKGLGFLYDSSLWPIAGRKVIGRTGSGVFEFPNGIFEIPLTVHTLAGTRLMPSGGGYFRLLPYLFSRWVIRRQLRRHGNAVTYHHNYEFFDHNAVQLPRMPGFAPGCLKLWIRKVICARTCGPTVRAKFDRLLDDFKFCPLSELLPAAAIRQTPGPIS